MQFTKEPAMRDAIPRRILMTADAVGGVWTYALELARALKPSGIEFALATMGPKPDASQQCEAARLGNVSLLQNDYRLEWMDEPWHDVDRAGDWLLETAERFDADLIHLNGYCHAALDWNLPVLVVAHSCVVSWWSAVKGEELPGRYHEYRRRVSAGLAAADLVVAPTAAMLRSLGQNYGWRGASRVIPNGRDLDEFAPVQKRPFILTAGRAWDEAKNVAALDRIAADLQWPVFAAGVLQRPDGNATFLPNLHSLGRLRQQQLSRQLGAASIFAMPARYEPFGLSALEAGLCECALVLGNIPSLREVWGDAAIFVDPDDHRQLAETVNNLIDAPGLRAELGRRARQRALQFPASRTADSYATAYRELIARNSRELTGGWTPTESPTHAEASFA
jgi:glycogen(starch) synthase